MLKKSKESLIENPHHRIRTDKRDRQTDRQAGRQTDRQTDRQTERHADKCIFWHVCFITFTSSQVSSSRGAGGCVLVSAPPLAGGLAFPSW